jgi:hypothetical protein
MTDPEIFDKKGNVRAISDDELASLSPARRALFDVVIVAASDLAQCDAMIDATQRSLTECIGVMAQVQENIKANSPTALDAARSWMDTTRRRA